MSELKVRAHAKIAALCHTESSQEAVDKMNATGILVAYPNRIKTITVTCPECGGKVEVKCIWLETKVPPFGGGLKADWMAICNLELDEAPIEETA